MRKSARIMLLVLVACLLAWGTGLYAQEKPLTLGMTGNLVVTETESGKKVEKLKELPEEVNNGDIIQYTIKSRNTSKSMLRNIEVIGNVPDGTSFVDKSTKSSIRAEIFFSIDKGKNYAKPPIKIKVRRPDGTFEEQEVAPDKYTNVKFVIGQLNAEEESSHTYRVRVK